MAEKVANALIVSGRCTSLDLTAMNEPVNVFTTAVNDLMVKNYSDGSYIRIISCYENDYSLQARINFHF